MDNSLKQELEAEIRDATKKGFKIRVLRFWVVFAICAFGVFWSIHSLPGDKGQDETLTDDTSVPTFDEAPDAKIGTTPEPTIDANTPTETKRAQASAPQAYTPPAQGVNRAAFIAAGNNVVANYNQITGLVTFSSSMSDDEKASRIKQAVALDRQAFGRTVDLRSQLVVLSVSSGPYMDATQLAESGVSKISVGLTFMNYWANDYSRTNDLNSGLGGVGQGANVLLQFSQKMNTL